MQRQSKLDLLLYALSAERLDSKALRDTRGLLMPLECNAVEWLDVGVRTVYAGLHPDALAPRAVQSILDQAEGRARVAKLAGVPQGERHSSCIVVTVRLGTCRG